MGPLKLLPLVTTSALLEWFKQANITFVIFLQTSYVYIYIEKRMEGYIKIITAFSGGQNDGKCSLSTFYSSVLFELFRVNMSYFNQKNQQRYICALEKVAVHHNHL